MSRAHGNGAVAKMPVIFFISLKTTIKYVIRMASAVDPLDLPCLTFLCFCF